MTKAAPTLVEVDREASVREFVPRLLDADQIADLMSMDKRQVYRLVHEGRFPKPSVEVGRYKRWRASDYVAWVEAQQAVPPDKRKRARIG